MKRPSWIVVAFAGVVGAACARPPAAPPPAPTAPGPAAEPAPAAPHVKVLAGAQRASLPVGAYPFGAVRYEIVDASTAGVVALEVGDGARAVELELPRGHSLDDATSVMVARLGPVSYYGKTRVADTAALEGVARRDASAETIALVRATDDVSLVQIHGAAEALKRAGFAHVVLGLIPPGAPPPTDGWASCPFPAAADGVDDGMTSLEVDWDEEGHPGGVRVLRSSGHGFGGAAVLCALQQRQTPNAKCTPPCSSKIHVRFLRSGSPPQ